MKVEQAYIRRKNKIFDVETKALIGEPFKSINAAKRWSAVEQKAHGGLGMGYVRVERS